MQNVAVFPTGRVAVRCRFPALDPVSLPSQLSLQDVHTKEKLVFDFHPWVGQRGGDHCRELPALRPHTFHLLPSKWTSPLASRCQNTAVAEWLASRTLDPRVVSSNPGQSVTIRDVRLCSWAKYFTSNCPCLLG